MSTEHSKVWVDGIKAKLQLLSTECGHCPKGERLEVADLNEILELFVDAHSKFLLICELNGFKRQPPTVQ